MRYRTPVTHKNVRSSEAGMASIVITMVTMVVISLIVLGFATISRREQSNTLDQQLSTQAFYAAESGVEDAHNVINAAIKAGKDIPGKTDCSSNTDDASYSPNYPVGSGTVLDAAHNVSYSCLLVNPTPSSLVYNGLGSNSVVAPLNASQEINNVTLTWTPPSGSSGSPSSCPSAAGQFGLQSKWNCNYALLRVDLVPTDGALTESGLASSTLTVYFEPTNKAASGQISYAGNAGGPNVVAANCGLSSYTQCTAKIVGLSGHRDFSVRVSSMYEPVDTLTIAPDHGGVPIPVSGAQVLVDVTGKANDVLRRIQVRLSSGGTPPTDAIESNGSLCKRFETDSGYFAIPGDIVDPDTANNTCVQQSYGTP